MQHGSVIRLKGVGFIPVSGAAHPLAVSKVRNSSPGPLYIAAIWHSDKFCLYLAKQQILLPSRRPAADKMASTLGAGISAMGVTTSPATGDPEMGDPDPCLGEGAGAAFRCAGAPEPETGKANFSFLVMLSLKTGEGDCRGFVEGVSDSFVPRLLRPDKVNAGGLCGYWQVGAGHPEAGIDPFEYEIEIVNDAVLDCHMLGGAEFDPDTCHIGSEGQRRHCAKAYQNHAHHQHFDGRNALTHLP